jgi:hypothetical protein
MQRRLATALVCALITITPTLTGSQSKQAQARHAALGAGTDDGTAMEPAKQPDSLNLDAPVGYPRDVDVPRSPAGERTAAVGPSIEAAIGAESDAKLDVGRKQNAPSQAPTRESICQVVSEVARENALPTPLFKRLIWQESRFRTDVVSSAGARGIAQFMPRTASERGLKNPFDPFQALPASGAFLRDLVAQFGNFGLAAAAYNGGPGRVSRWLAGKGGLPRETRNYVIQITGRPAEHWAEASVRAEPHPEAVDVSDCDVRPLRVAAAEMEAADRAAARRVAHFDVVERAASAWIALLTGSWSQKRAQTVYASLQKKYPKVLGRRSPTVRVAKAPGKRSAPKTVVRLVAESRAEAEELCKRLREAGGSCTVKKDPA